jgi:hypothetical protein
VYVNNGFQVFSVSVLDICFKCFICLQTYVASIASECFKSRSSVAHLMRVESGKGRQRSPLGRGPLDGRMKSRHGRGRGVQARAEETNRLGPRYRLTNQYLIRRMGDSSSYMTKARGYILGVDG